MENIDRAVFDKIAAVSRDGSYAIIDGDEFADALPAGVRRAVVEIDGAIKNLQKQGYIDLKYARGGTYCVAALKSKIAEPVEMPAPAKDESATIVEVKEKFNGFAAAMYAVAAFFGAAAGSAIVCAIFAAV